MEEKKVVKCFKCGVEFDTSKEKYATLGTFDNNRSLDESFFHFQCFQDWYSQKVNEKARNSVQAMQQQAQSLLGNLVGNVGEFSGMDQLNSMLGIDLDKKNNQNEEKEETKGNGSQAE